MKSLLLSVLAVVSLLGVSSVVFAQGGSKQGPQITRDADLEKDSLHNLEVARHYFKLKKAYVAALERCEEIIAANPAFSKIDEVLFIAGESNFYLAEGKGKQESALYVIREGESKKHLTPEQFRDNAREYLSQLVNSYPDSTFRPQANDTLRSLGGAKPKASGQ